MIRKEKNGIHTLQFEIFEQFKNLECVVFLRHGGFSLGNFQSLNLSYTVGDRFEDVKKNEERILNYLDINNVIRGNLSHGAKIIEASVSLEADFFDGMITNRPNLGLLITHADCQAACFYDPINHAIANVHSGWRGSVQNIYKNAVDRMIQTYGTDPKNLIVGITPSLGPHDAEFIHYKKELPKSFWEYQIKKSNFFDFWQISRMQLTESGIPVDQIEIASISTFSNPQDYFSYRLNNITGRNATLITLR